MSAPRVRVGPVNFQSLQRELQPVAGYLGGHLLDAGCGARDIGFLRAQGTTEITRYDISSDDPGVVIGPLEAMPFAEATFDAVLCNAVLEHVVDAEASMAELARVVRTGGHVVVAVPFLQPYHPCPGDYRRYTADGLEQLGRSAGLEPVAVMPVHTFAQTVGWLWWSRALERGGRLRRYLTWIAVYLLTRFSTSTDTAVTGTANTFQAVFRRRRPVGEDILGPWFEHELPDAATRPPTMLIDDELRLLHHLAQHYFTGAGRILDCGAFLGGSTVALAEGLRQNLARRGQPETPLIDSYDRFVVEDWTRGPYFPAETTPAGASFRDEFERNVADYAGLVDVHAGDIQEHPWTGGPIEILFIDCAKHWRTCDWITAQFFGHLIPGRSIVVQQDYLYEQYTAWLHVTMEFYVDYFEYVCDTGVNSVAFRCVKAIPPEVLREATVASLDRDERIALMDRAALRFTPPQRELMRAAKEQFLTMMDSE